MVAIHGEPQPVDLFHFLRELELIGARATLHLIMSRQLI